MMVADHDDDVDDDMLPLKGNCKQLPIVVVIVIIVTLFVYVVCVCVCNTGCRYLLPLSEIIKKVEKV